MTVDAARSLVEIRGGLSSADPEETTPWEQVRPRHVDPADRRRFQGYMGEIYSLCQHHALPFHGFAHVGYVSHERIIGMRREFLAEAARRNPWT